MLYMFSLLCFIILPVFLGFVTLTKKVNEIRGLVLYLVCFLLLQLVSSDPPVWQANRSHFKFISFLNSSRKQPWVSSQFFVHSDQFFLLSFQSQRKSSVPTENTCVKFTPVSLSNLFIFALQKKWSLISINLCKPTTASRQQLSANQTQSLFSESQIAAEETCCTFSPVSPSSCQRLHTKKKPHPQQKKPNLPS